MPNLVAYAVTLVVFLVLDALWLGLFAAEYFARELGSLLRPQPYLPPAAVFYLLYPAGLVALAVIPAIEAASWRKGARLGAILGLTAYGTFELTNLAIVQGWKPSLAVLDMAWGTLVSAIAAAAGAAAGLRWGR